MVNRVSPDLPARLVFTDTELKLLDHPVPREGSSRTKSIGACLIRLAKLCGYLALTRDAPPRNLALWRGMTQLIDIHRGFRLAKNVGN